MMPPLNRTRVTSLFKEPAANFHKQEENAARAMETYRARLVEVVKALGGRVEYEFQDLIAIEVPEAAIAEFNRQMGLLMPSKLSGKALKRWIERNKP
jgi:hypothetical protein